MNLEKLSATLAQEAKYRFQQINKALFQDYIDDWSKMSNLPKNLREKLALSCPLDIQATVYTGSGKNRSDKALITLTDGEKIETVLIFGQDQRNTICLSSQVGCAMNCSFCATGQMGFRRNLTNFEMVEQVIFWQRYLKNKNQKVDNIVFMGMGEPFNNYGEFIKAVKFINNPETLNIGARRISVSTVGIVEGIKKLAGEKIQINLAISLHAPNDNLREKLIPSAKKYKIKDILRTVDDYIEKTGRRVMFEYLLIKDINDSPVIAQKLAELLKKPLYLINLISYNPTIAKFQASPLSRLKAFQKILEDYRVPVTIRHSAGQNISAACGQLKINKTKSLHV